MSSDYTNIDENEDDIMSNIFFYVWPAAFLIFASFSLAESIALIKKDDSLTATQKLYLQINIGIDSISIAFFAVAVLGFPIALLLDQYYKRHNNGYDTDMIDHIMFTIPAIFLLIGLFFNSLVRCIVMITFLIKEPTLLQGMSKYMKVYDWCCFGFGILYFVVAVIVMIKRI